MRYSRPHDGDDAHDGHLRIFSKCRGRALLPSVLSRRQGDTVYPEAVVTGSFGNRDNRTGSRQAEESVADYSPTATRKILEGHCALKVIEVISERLWAGYPRSKSIWERDREGDLDG
jgi:hypothetical protein